MKNIDINIIKIPKHFQRTPPSLEKVKKIKDILKTSGEIDKPIVVDETNTLVENYTRYIAAQECGLTTVPCVTLNEYIKSGENLVTYIVGKFKNCDKKYTWKCTNKNKDKIQIGDKVLVNCNNKKGRAIVTVVEKFTSNNPALLKHKIVFKKIKPKEGVAIGKG